MFKSIAVALAAEIDEIWMVDEKKGGSEALTNV